MIRLAVWPSMEGEGQEAYTWHGDVGYRIDEITFLLRAETTGTGASLGWA
jgi:hypothetical protein